MFSDSSIYKKGAKVLFPIFAHVGISSLCSITSRTQRMHFILFIIRLIQLQHFRDTNRKNNFTGYCAWCEMKLVFFSLNVKSFFFFLFKYF